jgi:NADH-quinone oxidoreductase subunit A
VLSQFGQILVFVLLAVVFVVGGIVAAKVISPKKKTKEKLLTYECGETPVGEAWIKFNIRFYIIALVFIIFDVEVVFLFPWAVVFKEMGMIAVVEMFIFLGILFAGFIFLWARGDLEWVRPKPVVPKLEEELKYEVRRMKDEVKEGLTIDG